VTERARPWLRDQRRRLRRWWPPGRRRHVLGHLTPVSRAFGLDRGRAIDRFYIERFLTARALDIRGAVLEVGDDTYARTFGGDRVTNRDVLHVKAGHPDATLVADLSHTADMPPDAYDCVILTQTLQCILDVGVAIASVRRLLKPGCVVLATVPGISHISRFDLDRWGEYWRFTTLSMRRLFEDAFPGNVSVDAYGNVLSASAFLQGLAAEELEREELEYRDPDYELVIVVRAVK